MATPGGYTLVTVDNGGGDFTEVLGVNDAGEAVGYFQTVGQADASAFELGVFGETQGTPEYIYPASGAYTSSGAQTEAYAVNNDGSVVGVGATVVGALSGVSFGSSEAAIGGAGSSALGINDAGSVLGASGGHAVLISGATSTPLTVVTAGTAEVTLHAVAATGISDTDLVTGYYTVSGADSTTVDIAFYGTLASGTVSGAVSVSGPTVTSGSATILPTASQVLGLNNEGQVVGDFTNSQGTHGFVYDIATGTYVVIDDPNQSTASADTVVEGINDQGEIVGYYKDGNGTTHGFIGYVPGAIPTVGSPVAGTTIDLAPAAAGISVGGSGNVTIVDPGFGNAAIFANVGTDTVSALGNADSIVGSTGTMVVTGAGTADLVFFGTLGGSASLLGAGTVVAQSGTANVTMAGGGVLFGGAATVTATVGNGATVTGVPSGATVAGGPGTLSATFGDQGGVGFAGSGNATLVGGTGPVTLVGGSGEASLEAGSGSTLIWGETGSGIYGAFTPTVPGNPTVVAGLGASTILAAASTTAFLIGSSAVTVYDIAVSTTGGSGSETLVSAASTGNVTYNLGNASDAVFAGAGQTTVNVFDSNTSNNTLVGGSGAEVYDFIGTGLAGADTVYGFKQGIDEIQLFNQGTDPVKSALSDATFAGGNTKLHLTSASGNGTTITFIGVHLTLADFG